MNDTITEHDLLEAVRGSVAEMIEYTKSLNADDYDDYISEQADSLVSPWYTGVINEWYAANCPDAELLGGEYPEHDKEDSTLMRIAREASVAMYYWYHAELVRELDEQLEQAQEDIDAGHDTRLARIFEVNA
jgi:hypothetical protein